MKEVANEKVHLNRHAIQQNDRGIQASLKNQINMGVFQSGIWPPADQRHFRNLPMSDRFRTQRTWMATVAVVLVGLGTSYGLYRYLRPDTLPEQVIYGNGHIEGTEVRVSTEVAGRLVDVFMVEGIDVEVGEVIAQIDKTQYELERTKAKAELAAIEHERREVEQELATWTHHRQIAEREFHRYSALSARDVVSAQRLEEAARELRDATGRVDVLKTKIEAVDARLQAATAAFDLTERSLARTTIEAPIDGTVLVKTVEMGEYLPVGGGVGVLVDMTQLELKVFIPEKEIGKIHLQDPVKIRVDAYPDRDFLGSVARVDQRAQFTPREIHVPEERTRLVFGVILAIENPDGSLKPGMPADAWILWKPEAQWPEKLRIPQ